MLRPTLSLLAILPIWLAACVSEASDPLPTPSCELYCNEMKQKCGGEKQQYRRDEECMRVCSLLDLGTSVDGDVNTIGCRLRKVRESATLADCVAAGPYGGGVCGARCSTFCRLIDATCLTISTPAFGGDKGTCDEVCPSFAFDPAEGEGPNQSFQGKNTLNCREHHLIIALSAPEAHCGHADATSDVCR